MSEECCAIALDWALRNEGRNILIISKTTQDVFALAKRCRAMLESLGEKAPKLKTDSLGELAIKATGSTIYFRAGSSAGRGLPSAELIIFDEFAFFAGDTDDLAWAAALPSTEMLDGAERVVIISTPNGKTGKFWEFLSENNGPIDVNARIKDVREGRSAEPGYDVFKDASGWCKVLLHWRAHPIYSKRTDYINWVIKTKRLPKSKAEREYNLDFASGLATFIHEDLVYACAVGQLAEPEDDATYYAALDPAGKSSGRDGDYLVYTIVRAGGDDAANEVVAFHRGRKTGFERHKRKIRDLNEKYRPKRVLVEANGLGQLYLESLASEDSETHYEPITVSKVNRTQILDQLAVAIESMTVLYPAGIYAEELVSLEDKGSRVEAANGHHDDTCFSLAHALKAVELGPVAPSPFEDVDFGGSDE